MGASRGDKHWCYPRELFNSELIEVIGHLWALYAFDDGSRHVKDMMLKCEQICKDRACLYANPREEWTGISWPDEGAPVLEIIYGDGGIKSCRVVEWTIKMMGAHPYTYIKEHRYD